MKRPRIALSIRAQLLLVLTVFLALPWLGYEYVRELERVLRDAQERTLAGTAQAVATALHDRPRLFADPPDPIASFARERADVRDRHRASLPPSASPEIAQIIDGLSRTTARIWVIDRDGTVLARAGIAQAAAGRKCRAESFWARVSGARRSAGSTRWCWISRAEDFNDDAATQRDAERTRRRRRARRHPDDGPAATRPTAKAVIVSAAHPIWVGDQVRGVVVVEETGNAVARASATARSSGCSTSCSRCCSSARWR